MKKILSKIAVFFIKLLYPKFDIENYQKVRLLGFGFIQRVIGINRRVSWPVHFTTQIKAPENIDNGNRAPGFSIGCYLDGRNGIIYGKNVLTGPRVTIISCDHELNDYEVYKKERPVKIGKNSLLTSNCIILPTVELGEHTIVAAGAVVTKSFPEGNQLLAGNPARKIKSLPKYEGKFRN